MPGWIVRLSLHMHANYHKSVYLHIFSLDWKTLKQIMDNWEEKIFIYLYETSTSLGSLSSEIHVNSHGNSTEAQNKEIRSIKFVESNLATK